MRVIDLLREDSDLHELAGKLIDNNDAVSFTNPYSYLMTRGKDLSYLNGVFIDGVLLVLIARILGRNYARISMDFTSLATVLFKLCARRDLSVGIIGSTIDDVKVFRDTICDMFPGLNVVFVSSGFNVDVKPTAESLTKNGVDLIVVGMGAPKQEELIRDLRTCGYLGSAVTCGGFIEQTAKNRGYYYPRFFDTLNLRFLYRILDKPQLAWRYVFSYPAGVYFFVKDYFDDN